jgi:hypothetical protein
MPIKLTKVFEKINKIKTGLFYEEGVTAKFMRGNEVLLTLTEEDGFFISKNPTSNLAIGAEYFEMSVANTEKELEDALLQGSIVEFQGEKFEVASFFRPRGLTEKWEIRLQTIGK